VLQLDDLRGVSGQNRSRAKRGGEGKGREKGGRRQETEAEPKEKGQGQGNWEAGGRGWRMEDGGWRMEDGGGEWMKRGKGVKSRRRCTKANTFSLTWSSIESSTTSLTTLTGLFWPSRWIRSMA
jgi:hypothetical protein